MGSELTIVVCGDASAVWMTRLLGSLYKQDYPEIAASRIILANGPETLCIRKESARPKPVDTEEILESFRDRLWIEAVHSCEALAQRLNACVRSATTPYVLFLEADVELPDKTLIRRALETIRERQLELVTAGISCRHSGFRDDLLYLVGNLMQHVSKWLHPFATGKFMLFDREAFWRLGGFDERADDDGDELLSRRVARERFGIVPGKVLTNNSWLGEAGHRRTAWMFVQTVVQGGDARYFLRDGSGPDRTPHFTGSRFSSSERTVSQEVEAA